MTVAVQTLVTLVLLTLVFARDLALFGVVPTPGALVGLGELLMAGGEDVGTYAIPAPLTDGIELMMVGGVLVIGLAVDAMAVTFRSAAPAGLPLLALYSVAAGLSDGGAGWLWFVLAASGYLLLLLAEGRDRLSQWGRVFGGTSRTKGGLADGLSGVSGGSSPVRTGRSGSACWRSAWPWSPRWPCPPWTPACWAAAGPATAGAAGAAPSPPSTRWSRCRTTSTSRRTGR